MAITDAQLSDLHRLAADLGRSNDRTTLIEVPQAILRTTFDTAAANGMRTEDEFDAAVTLDDLPAAEDHASLRVAFYTARPEPVDDPITTAQICTMYLTRRGSLKALEARGLIRAHNEAAGKGNSEGVTAKLAISVALFDDGQDWPQPMRLAATRAYGLLPGAAS